MGQAEISSAAQIQETWHTTTGGRNMPKHQGRRCRSPTRPRLPAEERSSRRASAGQWSAVVDKDPKPGGEAIRFGKVDHVARAGPFLQLYVGDQIDHVLTLVAGEFVSEYGKAGRSHRRQLLLDSSLQLHRDTVQDLIPVAEYDVAVDATACDDVGLDCGRQQVQAHGSLENVERARETLAAQHGGCLLHQIGK